MLEAKWSSHAGTMTWYGPRECNANNDLKPINKIIVKKTVCGQVELVWACDVINILQNVEQVRGLYTGASCWRTSRFIFGDLVNTLQLCHISLLCTHIWGPGNTTHTVRPAIPSAWDPSDSLHNPSCYVSGEHRRSRSRRVISTRASLSQFWIAGRVLWTPVI